VPPLTAANHSSHSRPVYLSKLARKRIEAARIRHQLDSQKAIDRLRDSRNRISERIPMPRPAVIRESLDHGTVYTLLDWECGQKVGEFAADRAERLARQNHAKSR